MADVSMKFLSLEASVSLKWSKTHRLNTVQPSLKNRYRSVNVNGSGQVYHGGCVYEVSLV